jgi:hypothetical protein
MPAYGNVEHENTAIVSQISIKWARVSAFVAKGEGRKPVASLGMHALVGALVIVGATHVVAALAAHQLAAAALQPRRAVRAPLTHVFWSAIGPRLDRVLLRGESWRHNGETISLHTADSSGIDMHLIECVV